MVYIYVLIDLLSTLSTGACTRSHSVGMPWAMDDHSNIASYDLVFNLV